MLEVIALFVVVVYLVVLLIRSYAQESKASPLPPPYPGGLPLIGHVLMLKGGNTGFYTMMDKISNYCLENGGITYTKLDMIYYYLTDPEDAMTVANTCLDKSYGYDFLFNWIGYGMITSKEHVWKRHRKLYHPVFNPTLINSFIEIFNSQAEKIVKDMEPHCGKGPFNITTTLANVILETSSMTVFGQVKRDKAFLKYKEAVDTLGKMAIDRFRNFFIHNDLLYSLAGLEKKEAENLKTVKALSNEVFRTEKAKMESEKGSANSNVKLNTFGEEFVRIGVNAGLTDLEIIHEIDTIIAASFDTSTNQFLFVLTYVGSFPEVQEKVYTEVMEVIGQNGIIDKDSLTKLVYTEAVIKEVMRLLPTTPISSRAVTKDVKLKNYTLRAGSIAIVMHTGLNRHQIWGPDAHEFRPERWFERDTLPPASLFSSFGIGKRACAGRTYAMLNLKTNLAHIIRAYKIRSDYTKLVCSFEVTLKPIAGHEITLEKRKIQT